MDTSSKMGFITVFALLALLFVILGSGMASAAITDGGEMVIRSIVEINWARTAAWLVVGSGTVLFLTVGEFLLLLRAFDRG